MTDLTLMPLDKLEYRAKMLWTHLGNVQRKIRVYANNNATVRPSLLDKQTLYDSQLDETLKEKKRKERINALAGIPR